MLDFDRYDIENIILCMADIVMENRDMRKELKRMREYEKKYHKLIYDNLKESEESNKELLKAIFAGAFNIRSIEKELNNQ